MATIEKATRAMTLKKNSESRLCLQNKYSGTILSDYYDQAYV
jgi:hypothetical protein